MLQPARVKHTKVHKGKLREKASRGTKLSFGSFGLKAEEIGYLNSKQIEAGRRAISNFMKREGKLWIRIFPDRPFTAKAAEVGMGKGKGDPQGYEVQVWPGRIIFELDGLDEVTSKEALRKAGAKLPLKTRIVSR